MSPIVVAVAGVTGKLGRRIAANLLENPGVSVRGIARTPSKVPANLLSNPRFSVYQADINSTYKLREALSGATTCVCCYLGDDSVLIEGQKTLIDACIAEKVNKYIASDFSFDFRGLKLGDIAHKDFTILIADYLEQKKSEIQHAHILNGAFMEVVWSPFLNLYDPASRTLRVWGTGDEKLESSTFSTTAQFAAQVAVDPSATGYLEVLGDRKSAREMVKIYSDVYGEAIQLEILGTHADLLAAAEAAEIAQPNNPFVSIGMLLFYYMINGSCELKAVQNNRYTEVEVEDLRTFLSKTSLDRLPKLMC